MSDFLSNFNKDKYDDLANEPSKKKEKSHEEKDQKEEKLDQPVEQVDEVDSDQTTPTQDPLISSTPSVSRESYRRDTDEDVEIDPDYRKKKKRQIILILFGVAFLSVLLFFVYHLLVHVKVEDFVDKPIGDARAWARDNGVEVAVEQEYSLEYGTNQIMSQSVVAGDKIRKGRTLELVSSLGPDPDENIPLPDFSEMSQIEAENWIDENKASNLRVVMEYSDDIEAGDFIKLAIRDSGIDESEYRRKDSAAVYYSRGEEVFEKNITVPDFIGKPKEEVDEWVEQNEIEMTYKEADSDEIEIGHIISQSIEAEDQVAKRDEMEVVVSLGEAAIVPDFRELTADEAASNYPELEVTVKEQYHANVGYGKLISQSIEPETKLIGDDDKRVTVIYSIGKPYLKDLRGQLEGDLPQLFFEEFQSKGANIKYTVKTVNSWEEKGEIVAMSKYNEFVPMNYTVEISISNNALKPPEPTPPDDGDLGGGNNGDENPDSGGNTNDNTDGTGNGGNDDDDLKDKNNPKSAPEEAEDAEDNEDNEDNEGDEEDSDSEK